MIKETFPVFAPHTDDGHEAPKDLEKPGEMGRTLLNRLYEEWEEEMLLTAAYIQAFLKAKLLRPQQVQGMARHWRDFRKYLLTVHNDPSPFVFDMQRFGATEEVVQTLRQSSENMAAMFGLSPKVRRIFGDSAVRAISGVIPMQIAAWVRGSQRIFSLSEEATATWKKINFGGHTWEDILMPFDAFLIELREPLPCDISGALSIQKHGFMQAVLVTKLSSIDPQYPQGYFECRPLITTARREVPNLIYSRETKKKLKAIAKGQRNPNEIFEVTMERDPNKTFGFSVMERNAFHVREDELVTASDVQPLTNDIRKIIAGTCLYLLKKKSERVDVVPPPPRPSLTRLKHMNVITDPSQVISIGHVHNFDPQAETEGINYEGGPRAPHHRRAHLRKPAGSPENAPKTIPVRATVVNRHLLPRDAIPQGTVTKLESS